MDAAAFVLKDFSAAERKDLGLEVDRTADAVEALLSEGWPRPRTFSTRGDRIRPPRTSFRLVSGQAGRRFRACSPLFVCAAERMTAFCP